MLGFRNVKQMLPPRLLNQLYKYDVSFVISPFA